VEHDRDTMMEADHLIDMGPGAGIQGGYVVAQGTPREVMRNPNSLTGKYLAGEREIAVPSRRRPLTGRWLTIKGASENNLRNINVSVPLGVITCVTGVSGSGKSTLVLDTLYRAMAQRLNRSHERSGAYKTIDGLAYLDRVVHVDQSPIGRTPRSNPATYTGLFTRGENARLRTGAVFLQRQGRALRGLSGRWHHHDRDAFPARRVRYLRGMRRQAL
jgi:excinuclease ABC subunit A